MPENKNNSNQNNHLWKRNKDIKALAPFMQKIAIEFIAECISQGLNIDIIETYRSPDRQAYLYEQGRVRPGDKVTKALPWQSWHQYALAFDVAFFDAANKPYWPKKDDPVWDRVDAAAEKYGLETLSFERPHYQITAGMHHTEAYRIAAKQGMLALWDVIQKLSQSR